MPDAAAVQTSFLAPVPPAGEPRLLAEVAIDCPGHDTFTYAVPGALLDLALGDCVEVPFRQRRLRGFIAGLARRAPPPYAIKDILARRPGIQVPPALMRLCAWAARYYRCGLGEFLSGVVPAPVRDAEMTTTLRLIAPVAGFAGRLTAAQRAGLAALPAEPTPLDAAAAQCGLDPAALLRLVKRGALQLTTTAVERRRSIREISVTARDESAAIANDEQAAAIAAVLPHLLPASEGTVAAAGSTGSGATAAATESAATRSEASKPPVFLLHGVTGSGKTLVYLDLAAAAIARGHQVLFLLPEIGLTPQLAARVRARIDRVVVWHSGFTPGERAEAWRRVAAGEADLVLGTRSALFAPLSRLGLLIVDEEHDTSYKQDAVPRYQARDLAVVSAAQARVPVLLGSATPSLESTANARAGRYRVLRLTKRPAGGSLPTPVIVDMRAECHAQHRSAVLSRALIDGLTETRQRGEQSIILLNRRGWAPVISCGACGHTLQCPQCDVALTWHKGQDAARCHWCGYAQILPRACPACAVPGMGTHGVGSEQLAELLRQAVPGLRVLRLDADSTGGRQGHAAILDAFARGEADCLCGTQMVAKGLDFARVTLVGVLAADRSLAMPDFRSGERTYQLIAQVAGRAGRGAQPGTAIVQAFDTTAPALVAALQHQARSFYDSELALRQQYGYPPSTGLVRLVWTGPQLPAVEAAALADGERLRAVRSVGKEGSSEGETSTILGPNPCDLTFLKGQHRYHALIKAPSRAAAQRLLDRLGILPRHAGVHLSIDVDPYHFA